MGSRDAERSRPARRRGFTVVEVLIIVVVIALISIVMIPIFLSTLDISKQKRTMSDMNQVGLAMMSWIQDQLGAAAAGMSTVPIPDYGDTLGIDQIEALLVPQYIQMVPEFDGWGGRLEYRVNLANLASDRLIAVRSPGRDMAFSTDVYETGMFDPVDFNQDIVWADGIFVRWPQKQ